MSALRIGVLCPGRGSYGATELGLLGRLGSGEPAEVAEAKAAMVAELDALRAARGAGPLAELDGAPKFSPKEHLRSDNASELILACAAADLGLIAAAERRGKARVVAVAGNSLGFYTALFAAGALSRGDAARLVSTMASLQVEGGVVGGQLVYPVCDAETWALDAARLRLVEEALRTHGAHVSIRLGGTLVLAGSDAALDGLVKSLPAEERRGVRYPLRLAGHSAFHTPLMQGMSDQAQERLLDLVFGAPRVPLLDGRGAAHRPLSSDADALAEYTLITQVLTTYDFAASVRVLLREYAPDVLVALGPGDTLGGPIGQVAAYEGWRGIRDAASFKALQATEKPLLLSLGRPQDRRRFLELASA